MEYFFYFFIFFLCSSIVLAVDYPINYTVGTITDCTSPINISVTASMPIDLEEYVLNCPYNVTWICPCNTPIIISVRENTVNKYTLHLSYIAYEYYTTPSSGGGGGVYYPNNITNATIIINKTIEINNISKPNNPLFIPEEPAKPIIQPQPITNIYPQIINTTNVPENVPKPLNIFQKIWAWIKKILFYKLW